MTIRNEVFEAAQAIYDLYQTRDGCVGGMGHIVFDDENFDMVDVCLRDINASVWADMEEETRELSIKALELCRDLTEEEVAIAVWIKRHMEEHENRNH